MKGVYSGINAVSHRVAAAPEVLDSSAMGLLWICKSGGWDKLLARDR